MTFQLSDRFWGYFNDHGFLLAVGSRRYTLNTPKAKPLFSERNGYQVPWAKIGGWRLFVAVQKIDI